MDVLDRLVTREITPERDWFLYKLPQATAEEFRPHVRELNVESAQLVWNELIRRNQYKHPRQLPRRHWSRHPEHYGPIWESVWNRWIRGEEVADPDPVVEFLRGVLSWPDELPVLFVTHRDHAYLTTWGAFLKLWKFFLYFDRGPILVSWERPEFVQWGDGGYVCVGTRT